MRYHLRLDAGCFYPMFPLLSSFLSVPEMKTPFPSTHKPSSKAGPVIRKINYFNHIL